MLTKTFLWSKSAPLHVYGWISKIKLFVTQIYNCLIRLSLAIRCNAANVGENFYNSEPFKIVRHLYFASCGWNVASQTHVSNCNLRHNSPVFSWDFYCIFHKRGSLKLKCFWRQHCSGPNRYPTFFLIPRRFVPFIINSR